MASSGQQHARSTREDIARLGELIVALEEKVDQLDDRLAWLERNVAAAMPSTAATPIPKPAARSGATWRRTKNSAPRT